MNSDNKYIRYNLLAQSFTTDVTQWAIDDAGVYIENPEYIYVKTDKECRVLLAIKPDGKIYWGAGVPQQVIDYVNEKISELGLDKVEDIVTFLGDLVEGDTLAMLLNNKVDKETGKSLINAVFASSQEVIENQEWLKVTTDNKGKILNGTKKDGIFYVDSTIQFRDGARINSDIANAVDNLKIEEYNSIGLWEQGGIRASSGEPEVTSKRIRTKDYIDKSVDVVYMNQTVPYYPVMQVRAFDANDNYLGIVQRDDFSIANTASDFEGIVPLRDINIKYPLYNFKLVLLQNNNIDITTEYSLNCSFKNLLQARMDRIEYNKPIVTFTDDDGESQQFDNWKMVYDACGVCPTMALVTSGISQEDLVKIKQYGDLGFEYISHTHGHSDLSTRSEEQLRADFSATTAALRELGTNAANPNILAIPFGHTNDLVKSVANDYFKCCLGDGVNKVNGKPLDRFYIYRESFLSKTRKMEVEIGGETVEVAAPKNLEEWKPLVDDLMAKKGWLVIVTHFRNSYEQDHYYFGEQHIQAVVDLAKYVLSRGCEILTAGAAYEKFKNRLEVGKLTDEHYYIVDCDNVVYEK